MRRVHTWAWVGVLIAGLLSPAAGRAEDLTRAEQEVLAADKSNDQRKVIRIAEKCLPLSEAEFGKDALSTEWWVYQLGRSYQILGEHAQARPHLERVIDSTNQDGTANYRRTWAYLFLARGALAAGEFTTALKHNAAAEKAATDTGVTDDAMRTEFPSQRGLIHQSAGEFEKAIAEYEAQGQVLKAIHGEDSPKAVWGEENAAWCECRLGRFAAARKRFEAVAKVHSNADLRASRGYLLARLNVAHMHLLDKERAKAEAIFTYTEKVLKTNADRRTKAAAADNPFNSGVSSDFNSPLEDADVCDRLAEMYTLAARHRDTVAARTRAYDLTAADPKGTPEAIYLRLDMLGRAYYDVEDFKKSQAIQADALARAEKLFKADPSAHAWRVIRSLMVLASCEQVNGQYRQAEDHFAEAVRVAEKHLPGSVNHADALSWYAYYLSLAGRTDHAMEVSEQADDIYRRRQGSDAKRKAGEQFAEAVRMIDRGEDAQGQKLFEQAHAAMLIHDREQAVRQLRSVVDAHLRKKDNRTALAFADREIELSTEVHGADTWQTMDARLHVSQILRKLGDYKRARAEIQTATRFFATSDAFNLCKL